MQTFFTYFAIYFIIWWLCLFIVLPFGSQSQAEASNVTPGTDPGAPVNPQLAKKLLANTLLSLLVLGAYWVVTVQLGFSLNDVANLAPSPN